MGFAFEKQTDHPPGDEVRLFEAYLRDRGLKLTDGRRRLVELVFSDHSHFTAEDLYDRCRQDAIGVSKATLYRTLTILTDCKLLVAHDFGEGSKYYEHVYGHRHHDHIFCIVCKSIAEFQSEAIERLQDQAAAELGFRVVRHALSIFGVCGPCQNSARGRAALAEAETDMN